MPKHASILIVIWSLSSAFVPKIFSQTKSADSIYGTVFVYGEDNPSDGPVVTVTCDGRDVAKVSKNRFFVLHLPPGMHEIDAKKKGDADAELRKQLSRQFWGESRPSTAQLNVDAGSTHYVSIMRLEGAMDIDEERIGGRAVRTSFTKKYFWEAEVKVKQILSPQLQAQIAKEVSRYPKLAEALAAPESLQYYCPRCKPIDVKWIIDKQLVVIEPTPSK
jgi:hypothetical protein